MSAVRVKRAWRRHPQCPLPEGEPKQKALHTTYSSFLECSPLGGSSHQVNYPGKYADDSSPADAANGYLLLIQISKKILQMAAFHKQQKSSWNSLPRSIWPPVSITVLTNKSDFFLGEIEKSVRESFS